MSNIKYNAFFLEAWMRRRGLQRKDILGVLGTKDYATLNKYCAGTTTPSIDHILRICNHYDLPLSSFFYDADSIEVTECEFYERVRPHIDEESVVTTTPTATPPSQSQQAQALAAKHDSELLRQEVVHKNEILQLIRDNADRVDNVRRDDEIRFATERQRYIDIIERQRAEIEKLTLRISSSHYHYGEVAEDEIAPKSQAKKDTE